MKIKYTKVFKLKRLIIFSIILLVFMCSCEMEDDILQNNTTSFVVNNGRISETYNWKTLYSNIGFISSGSYYINIFKSDSGHKDESTFYSYLFIDVAGDTVGEYSSANGKARISYYDSTGKSYFIFSTRDTYANITITEWTQENIEGEYSVKLMNYPTYNYITITGSFKSFLGVKRNKDVRIGLNIQEFENRIRREKEFEETMKTKNLTAASTL